MQVASFDFASALPPLRSGCYSVGDHSPGFSYCDASMRLRKASSALSVAAAPGSGSLTGLRDLDLNCRRGGQNRPGAAVRTPQQLADQHVRRPPRAKARPHFRHTAAPAMPYDGRPSRDEPLATNNLRPMTTNRITTGTNSPNGFSSNIRHFPGEYLRTVPPFDPSATRIADRARAVSPLHGPRRHGPATTSGLSDAWRSYPYWLAGW